MKRKWGEFVLNFLFWIEKKGSKYDASEIFKCFLGCNSEEIYLYNVYQILDNRFWHADRI